MTTFISNGTPITQPSPQYDLPIVSNNGVLKARHQSGLPLGYALLDYIESTGTQYIDTGVKFTGTKSELDAVATCTNSGNWCALAATQKNTNTRWGSMQYGKSGVLSYFACAVGSTPATVDVAISFDWTNGHKDTIKVITNTATSTITTTFNGETKSETFGGSCATDVNLYLGCKNTNGTITEWFVGKIYSFSIKIDDAVVRNFVPAKNSSNVIGMYDTVSGTFFTNAGTGTFTAGNPVSDPVEIYADGTQETIAIRTRNIFDNSNSESGFYEYNSLTPVSNNIYRSVVLTLPAGTYTISQPTPTGTEKYARLIRVNAYNDNILQGGQNIAVTPYTFTITSAKQIRIGFGRADTADGGSLQTEFTEEEFKSLRIQLESGSTATDYVPRIISTATAEMLLKVGDYQDVQSIIDGVVTRNVGVKVLDGTEEWSVVPGTYPYLYSVISEGIVHQSPSSEVITHFQQATIAANSNNQSLYIGTRQSTRSALFFRYDSIAPSTTAGINTLKTWLAQQYAAGTPVIIVYPLATPTTESVTGQTLQVTAGDNTLEITQASLNNLELEAKYKKGA